MSFELCSLSFAAGASLTRNILLVIADDLGADSLALYNTNAGATFPPTPTLNALAARGVLFRNAYAQPVCSPSRAAMITGRYAFRTGVTAVLDMAGEQGIYTNEFTLPEVLAATHRCASIGKWHLGGTASAPNSVGGWPYFSGSLAGALGANATNYYLWTKTTNGVSRPNYFGYATTDNVNDALAWISAQGTNRWFLWLGFNAPHTPYHKPPTNLCPHYATLSGSAMDIQQNPRSYFEAMMEALDTEFARLLAGINTNETTILFLGDNGTAGRVIQPPYNSQRAKDTLYEGGIRVPLFIAGPDVVNPGRTNDAVVHCVDLYATILELAGVNLAMALPANFPFDSRSLMPVLLDQPFAPAQDAVLVEDSASPLAGQSGRAARRGDFKLLRFTNSVEEFYNVAADALEATNLLTGSLNATQQAALDTLRARLDAWQNFPNALTPQLATQFSTETAWFANANLSLLRSPNVATTNWTQITNATVQDRGFTLRLTDPQPPNGAAFYRVQSAP